MKKIGFNSRRVLAIAAASAGIIGTVAFAQQQARVIYPDKADAKAEIQAALDKATTQHKRVILDFGGNWCGDCHALDTYFRQKPNASLLKGNFILVDVNIGKMDQNLDVAKKYEVPLDKGVPALAVLDGNGNVLYSQKNGEFEDMRHMDSSSVTKFLQQWKPTDGK